MLRSVGPLRIVYRLFKYPASCTRILTITNTSQDENHKAKNPGKFLNRLLLAFVRSSRTIFFILVNCCNIERVPVSIITSNKIQAWIWTFCSSYSGGY